MKLIIDIDDETYNDIKKGKIYSSFRDVPLESVNAIANGTPLDNLTADLEALREPTEPHLVDYRYHRNDMLDMVLGVIERYRNEVSS